MTRILIIEDSSDLRDDIVETLSLEGYETLGAENGLIGVQLAHEFKPDLIVCDIAMPELDGYGVLEQLRKDPTSATIPFIFLTAKTDRSNVRHGMVLGADDYLTKPFLIAELLTSIDSQLKKREELNVSANRRLEELRENIITALPHELRTPLNTIIGFSDMMMMEANRLKPDQVADWSAHINGAAHRLYRLVENYIYYAQLQIAITTGVPMSQTQSQISSIDDIIHEEAGRIARQANRESDLTLEIDPSAIPAVTPHEMMRLVFELTDNAFKFSTDGQPVMITSGVVDGAYQLVVSDNGRGFAADLLNTIRGDMDVTDDASIGAYNQFNRRMHEQQGLGLGLAIVKSIVKLFGGSLYIQSDENHGATIIVHLPLL